MKEKILDNMVNDLKVTLIDLLTNTNFNYDLFNQLNNYDHDIINLIKWHLCIIEQYKEDINKGRFKSIEEADKVFNEIVTSNNKLIGELQKIK